MQHLLRGNVGDGLSPSIDGLELFSGKALVDTLLQAESGVEVLTHDGMFEFRRFTQHVDQRLAVLDDKRCFR